MLPHRALEVDEQSHYKNVALVECYWHMVVSILGDSGWRPVQALLTSNGLGPLLQVVSATNRSGLRNSLMLDSAGYALDILRIVTLLPDVRCWQPQRWGPRKT